MRLLIAIIAVLMIILGVTLSLLPLALFGAAILLLVDPLRPRGEGTWDAMWNWDRYQRTARARQERMR